MKAEFFKYQGAGNDFVIIDNRELGFPSDDNILIERICNRKFGVGADGLMLLESSDKTDFKMLYFNADGHPGSMCGNGGRCIVAFARRLGICIDETRFEAVGEIYTAEIDGNGTVSLAMTEVDWIEAHQDYAFLDTGSPHHVTFTDNIDEVDVFSEGRKIRQGKPYFEQGTNVNFVEQKGNGAFKVRTYERGVEDETLSCGTGVTAVALASYHLKKTNEKHITIHTLGGDLFVDFDVENNKYHNIILSGPATFVFKGLIDID